MCRAMEVAQPALLDLCECHVDELVQGRPTPQLHRLVEEAQSVGAWSRSGAGYELLEPPGVDFVSVDGESVAAGLAVHFGDGRQTAAQPRHLGAQRAGGILR